MEWFAGEELESLDGGFAQVFQVLVHPRHATTLDAQFGGIVQYTFLLQSVVFTVAYTPQANYGCDRRV